MMKKKEQIFIYDTTLRDGSQGEGVFFNGEDKVKVALLLDEFGIDFIEGGWPGSNPKDSHFFKIMKTQNLKHARLVAFGSTRRKNISPSQDKQLQLLLEADCEMITIFGKSWNFHVEHVLKTTSLENLKMIEESVTHLTKNSRKVIYDAEHFFDAMKNNPSYAMQTLKAAVDGGAIALTLCDTNGGSLPSEISAFVAQVVQEFSIPIGIHCHNDSDLAVANTLAAVQMGATHVQGVMNGYGERCGNANLCSVIPNLILKMNRNCECQNNLTKLKEMSYTLSELANMLPPTKGAYVGRSAFAHKGGTHVNAVQKNPKSFEHIDPSSVGNKRRILISDLSGKMNVICKAREFGLDLEEHSPAVLTLLNKIKERESEGYSYEGADASLKLFFQRFLNTAQKNFFDLKNAFVMVRYNRESIMVSEAVLDILIQPEKERVHVVSDGNGPVEALDRALRKALIPKYPSLQEIRLTDYKVRVLNGTDSTKAKVRVLITSQDKTEQWCTVGVSENIVEASLQALFDGFEYKLMSKCQKS